MSYRAKRAIKRKDKYRQRGIWVSGGTIMEPVAQSFTIEKVDYFSGYMSQGRQGLRLFRCGDHVIGG